MVYSKIGVIYKGNIRIVNNSAKKVIYLLLMVVFEFFIKDNIS
jgi:hypothetical protein